MHINTLLNPLNENVERIESENGYIDISPNPKFSDRPSIVNLYVDDNFRGKGQGTELVSKALIRYPDLGGQAGSRAGVVTMYKAGMRPYADHNASLDKALKMFDDKESLYLISLV